MCVCLCLNIFVNIIFYVYRFIRMTIFNTYYIYILYIQIEWLIAKRFCQDDGVKACQVQSLQQLHLWGISQNEANLGATCQSFWALAIGSQPKFEAKSWRMPNESHFWHMRIFDHKLEKMARYFDFSWLPKGSPWFSLALDLTCPASRSGPVPQWNPWWPAEARSLKTGQCPKRHNSPWLNLALTRFTGLV